MSHLTFDRQNLSEYPKYHIQGNFGSQPMKTLETQNTETHIQILPTGFDLTPLVHALL